MYFTFFTLFVFLTVVRQSAAVEWETFGLTQSQLGRVKRHNFNFGYGHALGQGDNFQYGAASNIHKGQGSGFVTQDGSYHGLNQNSDSASNAWSTGYGAPSSFASGGSKIRPGGAGGFTNVGHGGVGNSYGQDYSQSIAVPLPNGNTYLSNLKVKDNYDN